jgi:hypothetical protein
MFVGPLVTGLLIGASRNDQRLSRRPLVRNTVLGRADLLHVPA